MSKPSKRLKFREENNQEVQKFCKLDDIERIAQKEKQVVGLSINENVFTTVEDVFRAAVDRPNRQAKPPKERFSDPDALKDFQQQGLGWLLERENYVPETFEVSPGRSAWMYDDKSKTWTNTQTGVTTKDKPVEGYTGRHTQQVGLSEPVYGGILADDMGLGKTVQMISLIATHSAPNNYLKVSNTSKSTLVVVPYILLGTWESELKKWAPNLSLYVHWGSERTKQKDSKRLKRNDVVLTTYDTLKIPGDTSLLKNTKWWRIILDEGHKIKNVETGLAKAVHSIEARNRWIMSGTPIQNNLRELYSLLKFLRVRPYGEMQGWYRLIEQPITQIATSAGQYRRQATENLRNLIRVLVLRRTKKTRAGQSVETGGDPLLKPGLVIQLSPYVRERISPKKVKFWKVIKTNFKTYSVENAERRDTKLKRITDIPYIDEKGENTYLFVRELVHIPEKRFEWIQLDLNERERKIYKSLEEEGIGAIEKWVKEEEEGKEDEEEEEKTFSDNPLVFLLRLRQAAIHPWLISPTLQKKIDQVYSTGGKNWISSSKFQYVSRDLAQTLDGRLRSDEKSLVFSQFTRALDLFEIELQTKGWARLSGSKVKQQDEKKPKYVRIDGSSTRENREWAMRQLKENPKVKLALLSLHAAGVGLNLISANNVYFLDLFFNPQVHAQAIDRTHRIGQDKEVVVKTVTMNGTVEDKLMKMQDYKNRIFEHTLKPFTLSKDKILELTGRER
jgi:SNF2 family DNA or RNA helicase